MSWPRFAGLTFILALLTLAQPPQAAQQTDRVTGLARNGDWQLVQANCTECHSALLITQNSGNRGVWQSRIAWMQETQGMAHLDPDVEERILAYLEENYGPRQSARRAPLPAHLLPENPWSPR